MFKSHSGFRLGYVPMLDIVRALAIIIVVLGHANFQLGQNGHFGVDVFFTLSGFLITTLLFEEWESKRRISFSAFYVRRSFRLFPALFLLLAAVLIYARSLTSVSDQLIIKHEVIAAFFYFYNVAWLIWPEGRILTHTWSLAVEEQFYFVWPWLCRIQLGWNSVYTNAIKISFLFVGIAAALSLVRWFNTSFLISSIFQEAIFIGVASAFFRWGMRDKLVIPFWLVILSWTTMILIGVMPYKLPGIPGIKIVVAVLTVICIYGAVANKSITWTSKWPYKGFIYIGRISYSWYLWHVPVFKWFKWHSHLEPGYQFVLKLIISILLAVLSYELFEKHMIKVGRRISNKLQDKSRRVVAVPNAAI